MSASNITNVRLASLAKSRIEVPEAQQVSITRWAAGWLKINSYDELLSNERAILERIARTVNGGNLFVAHPFQLLADLGVELSDTAKAEILNIEPHLSALSPVAYDAIKRSLVQQSVRFHVHGLFEGRPQ
jgi:hypothetical protein